MNKPDRTLSTVQPFEFTKDFELNFNPVLCTPKDYKDNFLKAVYHYEEPILNCSMPAYYQMSNYMKNKGILLNLFAISLVVTTAAIG